MADKNKKVVNTEEQNRVVNPRDKDYNPDDRERASSSTESSASTPASGTANPETEKPDGGSEVERPHRIEGEDADDIERKIPNM